MLVEVIESIAAQWDDVLRYLSAGEQATLIARVRDFLQSADEAARYDAAQEIVDLVAPSLPADHPIRRAIATEGTKLVTGGTKSAADELRWGPAIQVLSLRLESAGVAPPVTGQAGSEPEPGAPEPDPGAAEPGEILREAQESILAAPSVTEAQVRDCGVDPGSPGLIRLSGTEGDIRLPAFQFGPGGHPYPVVTQINVLLDAGDDPWGVADWWLGLNGWIDAIPAESIGRVDDETLIAAARAVFQEG
jgi:hypothetical protein